MRDVRLFPGLASLVLSACAVGPDYKRPDLVLPADYGVSAPTAPAGSIADEWWTLYDDALLNDLVRAALTRNPNIANALASIAEARAFLRETNSAFFPEIDLSGRGIRSRTGAAGGAGTTTATTGTGTTGTGTTGTGTTGTTATTGGARYGNLFQLQAGVSYELDLWGRLRRASESARAQLLASTYARDVTALSLASTTAQTYFTLRSLDAQIGVTQSTLDAVNDSLRIAKKRLDAGYASGLDYAQAQSLAAQTSAQRRDLARQRDLAQHQLARLTSNLTLVVEPGSIDRLPIPTLPPPGLPSTLVERRPDVRQAEQQLVSTNAQIGVYKAQLFPTFSLTGAYGGQSFEFSDLLKSPFRFWNIGLGFTQPIFAGGLYVARLEGARARNDEQIASYQSTVEGAFQEVADALSNVSQTAQQEPDVRTAAEASQRYLRLSRLQYDQGYAPYLNVLDATRTYNSAQLQVVQNRQQQLSYSVDLLRSLGGGWDATRAGDSPPSGAR